MAAIRSSCAAALYIGYAPLRNCVECEGQAHGILFYSQYLRESIGLAERRKHPGQLPDAHASIGDAAADSSSADKPLNQRRRQEQSRRAE